MSNGTNGAGLRRDLIRLGAVVVAIIVIGGAALFGNALYTGATTVPPETVTQIWVGIGTVFTAAVIAAVGWLQARTLRLNNEAQDRRTARIQVETARQVEEIRVEAAAEAERNRAHSDQNALQTQGRVEKLITDVNDGLIGKINEGTRTMVAEDNDRRAEALLVTEKAAAAVAESQRLTAQVATNSQAIQQVLALLTQQKTPPLPDVATGSLDTKMDQIIASQASAVSIQAIEKNTADTVEAIKDVSREDPGGTPV